MRAQLAPHENVQAALSVDLTVSLRFAQGLLVLTDQQIVGKDADGDWQRWPLAADLTLRFIDHAGVGTLEGDAWMTASLVNAPGASSYPLVAFSWLLLDPQAMGAAKARQLRDFVQWALTDGVEVATPLGYVPLPSVLAAAVQARLDRALGLPGPSGTRAR